MKTTFVVLTALAAALASAHPWSCFHGDPQHTGKSAVAVGDTLVQAWAFAADSEISGSPAVDDSGRVIFGARDTHVYCLTASGGLAWSTSLAGLGTTIYFSAPALDDSGNIYITTNRRLVKLSRGGVVRWSWPQHNSLSISHSPVIGLDGKIYFACYSDSLYAVRPDSTLAWARPLGASVNAAPAVGSDGRIYVATTRDTLSRKLWCFNPDGTSPWSFDLAAEAEFASPAVGPDSTVYVGAGRFLYAVGPNGTLKWRDSLAAQIQSCPAIANESTLYVVAATRLYCIGTDSVVRWRMSIGGSINYCSPAVDADGNVLVGTAADTSSMFYVIGPDSTVLWQTRLTDDVWSSPAIGPDGRVYLGCMNDTLYAFDGPGTAVAEPRAGAGVVGIRLLPNPTRGVARLVPAGRYSARVFDAAGSLVASVRDADRIDLRGLRRGVYLVRVAAPGCAPQKVVLH